MGLFRSPYRGDRARVRVLCVRVEIRDTSLKIIKGQVRTEYKEYHRELDEEEPHPEVVNREREKKKGKEEGITATRCSLV